MRVCTAPIISLMHMRVLQVKKNILCVRGVWFEELKFNKHYSTFVLFDKKFPILD
jgi:hypothetical protein